MKYKIGDTVVITSGLDKWRVGTIESTNRDSFNSYLVKLPDHTSRLIEEKDLRPYKSYEDGLNDAWELASKLGDIPEYRIGEIFNKKGWSCWDVIDKLSPQEAMKKLKEWDEIYGARIEDIVVSNDNTTKAVLIDKTGDNRWKVFTENGCVEEWNRIHFKKTEQKIDGLIDAILSELRKD